MRRPLPARRRQRGAFNILFLTMIVTLIGAMGLLVDVSRLLARRAEMQVAVDAAALAAAKSLSLNPNNYGLALAAAGQNLNHYTSFYSQNLAQNFITLRPGTVRFGALPGGPFTADGGAGTPPNLRYVRIDSKQLPGEAHGMLDLLLIRDMSRLGASTLPESMVVGAQAVAGPLGTKVGLHQ